MFLYSRYNSFLGISSEEILEISQDINQNFTPSASTDAPPYVSPISSEELLSISEAISRDYSPTVAIDVSELVILPVDPEHLYAYWNVVEDDTSIHSPNREEPLTLHIYSKPISNESQTLLVRDTFTSSAWYNIAVENNTTHWGAQLPVPNAGVTYSAEIGRFDGNNSFVPLINSSNQIHIPRAADISKAGTCKSVNFEMHVPELPNVQPIPYFILPVSENLSYLSVMSSHQGIYHSK